MYTFTKKTDYALLALSFLATEGEGRVVGPREISVRYDIPAELLAKVMQTLSKRNLVTSIPGPTGGYRLNRKAPDISIGEVIEAIDGPIAIVQCWDSDARAGGDNCKQAPHCHLRGPLARIQDEMERLLRTMTLADVCPPPKTEAVPVRAFSPSRQLAVLGSVDS